MKVWAILMSLLVSQASWALSWEAYLAQKRASVSHERHLPYRLTHGHKTAKSVLLVHGIFSSPLYFKGMARAFFDAGYNVVTVLLPGHYDHDLRSMNRLKNAAWSREVDQGYELARELGDKVILSGHSLGGLLSIEQALKRPVDEIDSLVLVSPSLKVWPHVMAACRAGVAFGLSGNTFSRAKPDGFQVPYFAPAGGPLIQDLADRVLTATPRVPVYLAYTWDDNVVDVPFVKQWSRTLKKERSQVRVYGLFSGVKHGSISQAPEDFSTHGNGTNPDFHAMMQEALDFVAAQ